MQLEEARALKQALLGGSVVMSAADGRSVDVVRPGSFVGIVPGSRPDGYRLAVRLTEPVDDVEQYVARVVAVVGEEVDVRYVGPIRALSESAARPAAYTVTEVGPGEVTIPSPADLQQRVRPLVRGASVAHRDVSAGTLGAFVTLGDSTAVHVLSNNHVLGNSDRGRPGDAILQPGTADGGTVEADQIGELLVTVPLDPDQPNLMDAALAIVSPETQVDVAAHDGPLTGVLDPAEVTGQVVKVGRTTGRTVGRITAFEVDGVPVGYDTGVYTFDDQVEIEGIGGGFSAGGDSGSVIYTEEERLGIGLLFAGSETGGANGEGVTYANSLPTVLAALGATLVE